MESRQLAYFRSVVDHGSFTLSAEALHMTQPSLSLVVQRLERELGIRLLERSRQGVRPTEAGAHLYSVAVKVLDQMDTASLHLRSLADGLAGRVTVSSTPIFNWGHLPSVLAELGRQAPDVDVVLEDPPPDHTIRNVLDGVVDLGIVTAWDVEQLRGMYGDRLEIQQAAQLPLVAVLPPSWGGRDRSVSLAELRDARWMMPATSTTFPGLPELFDRLWTDHPHLRPREIQKTSGVQTALPLVAAGLGVTVVPDTVRVLAERSVSIRPLADPVPPLHAAVVWQRGTVQSPAVRRLVGLLLDTGVAGGDARS